MTIADALDANPWAYGNALGFCCAHCENPAWNGTRGGIYPACVVHAQDQWECLIDLAELVLHWIDDERPIPVFPSDLPAWEDDGTDGWIARELRRFGD